MYERLDIPGKKVGFTACINWGVRVARNSGPWPTFQHTDARPGWEIQCFYHRDNSHLCTPKALIPQSLARHSPIFSSSFPDPHRMCHPNRGLIGAPDKRRFCARWGGSARAEGPTVRRRWDRILTPLCPPPLLSPHIPADSRSAPADCWPLHAALTE